MNRHSVKKYIILLSLTGMWCASGFKGYAQESTEREVTQLTVDFQYRPRAELTYGYRRLPNDTARAGFHVNHRGRVIMNYSRPGFDVRFSFQDARIWGEEDIRGNKGWLQLFELYAEPVLSERLRLRVGRQQVFYDNGRLFAENDFRLNGSAYDAVRLIYRAGALESHTIAAFNQTENQMFGTAYYPDFELFKVLFANFTTIRAGDSFTFFFTNFTDGYQHPDDNQQTHFQFTNGLRAAAGIDNLNVSIAGFYQWGRLPWGERHRAFYFSPEVRYRLSEKYRIRGGVDVFSGDGDPNDGTSRAFMAPYGAFHVFNGQIDYTAIQVRTFNHYGILNPYIEQVFTISPKVTLNVQTHLLGTNNGSQYRVIENGERMEYNRWYGFENDFRLLIRVNEYTMIDFLYTFLLPNSTAERLPVGVGGSMNNTPHYVYLSVNWTPRLFSWEGN